MSNRINRAIELLEQDQAIYYTGGHSGHVLTYPQGCEDPHVWADYMDVGMEHGAFDMAGLAEYMRGLVEGGPTRSGHRTPTVSSRRRSTAPTLPMSASMHGIPPDPRPRRSRRAALPSGIGSGGARLCRKLPLSASGSGGRSVFALAGRANARGNRRGSDGGLGIGTRGRGSEPTAAPVWGIPSEEYMERCDPWPLNPKGELLLGVKLESPEGIAHCEEILAVPGLGFAELGPGDLGLALGYLSVPRDPYPPEMKQARERVFAACRKNRVPFLETCSPENIVAKLDEGVRVIAGHREETARIGRAHQRRTMPV